ncbi:hypothetical protein N9L26_00760 [Candidatus Pacebacteria bacterium]|nr:hypothetical protein [Candidatus Paceibacterota bacterium]
MNKTLLILIVGLIIIGGYLYLASEPAQAPIDNAAEESTASTFGTEEDRLPMTFFITSTNPGSGADFGGLAGADAHCQALATAAGAGAQTWQAYLSADATDSAEAVNARDRIGTGPWHNYDGELIANSVDDLHSNAAISKETALTETGAQVNGRGDTPNVHDILTGSTMDGLLATAEDGGDTTCSNWSTESAEGSAVVGHHDRVGINDSEAMKSWVSSHGSRGCSLENLNSTGGGGLIYCFATD